MPQNTVTTVDYKLSRLNRSGLLSEDLSFNRWETGIDRYQLTNMDGSEVYGDVYLGATQFLAYLEGIEQGLRLAE